MSKKNKGESTKFKKINALVTAVGGAIGQGIIKSLQMSDLNIRIVGTDAENLAAGLYWCQKGYMVPRSDKKSADYLKAIIYICSREKIHIIFPGIPEEVTFFALNKKEIEEKTGCKIVVSSSDLLDLVGDKWNMYKFLSEKEIDTPRTFLIRKDEKNIPKLISEIIKNNPLPLILKPRGSYGSKGVKILKKSEDIDTIENQGEDMVLQEFLPDNDEEYTCGIFVTAEGKNIGTFVMKRESKFPCSTYRGEIGNFKDVQKVIESVAQHIKPLGPCNIQARKIKNRIAVFDINPRFSASNSMRANFGFNEAELSIKDMVLGQKIRPIRNFSKGMALRYWHECYIEPKAKKSIIDLSGEKSA
jgi:carbamoyl-phosphate synthase large subunit